jgi:hypothetical protein
VSGRGHGIVPARPGGNSASPIAAILGDFQFAAEHFKTAAQDQVSGFHAEKGSNRA